MSEETKSMVLKLPIELSNEVELENSLTNTERLQNNRGKKNKIDEVISLIKLGLLARQTQRANKIPFEQRQPLES